MEESLIIDLRDSEAEEKIKEQNKKQFQNIKFRWDI